MRLVLFQPDIPQNTGAMLRLAACLGVGVDIIEPCGFILDDKRLKRSAMDYLHLLQLQRYANWAAYQQQHHAGRLLLLTTKGDTAYTDCSFLPEDRIMVGQESCGVPAVVAEAAAARLFIPMQAEARSLNVGMAAAIVLGEANRQVKMFV